MSTTYLVRVFVAGIERRPNLEPDFCCATMLSAMQRLAQTATFHGSAWPYVDDGKDAYGALVSFDVGACSPLAGPGESTRLHAALVKAIRGCLPGKPRCLDVSILDSDRAAWYCGPTDL